jgi:hypothetical protein
MANINVCGDDLDRCSQDRCIVYINDEAFEAEKLGEFVETGEAPDYGCASFEFQINERKFAKVCNKFELTEEEEQLIRDRIASNWWGSSCAMCE